MIKVVRINVYGQVQGVFFRESARREALKLSLNGFARNDDDGGVCIEAEGGEENLKKLVDWSRKGPELARVENIEVEYSDDLKFYKDFEIL